jgi:flagellar hook-length control protein FliK
VVAADAVPDVSSTGPVAGAAPVPTVAPTAGLAASRPPSTTDVPGVAGQLVDVLSPPRPTAGGTYTVTIALHPDELGEVRATVTAGDDQVTVRLVASTGDGDDALRQALPQLHAGLSAGGQRTTVTVGGRGQGSSAEWTTGQPAADDRAGARPDPGSMATSSGGPSVDDPTAGGSRSPTGTPTTGGGTTGPQRRIDVRV